MQIDGQMLRQRTDVLKELVRAAAMDNADGLRKAKKRLIDSGFDADLVRRFNELPADVRTRDQVLQITEKLRDETQREKITTAWRAFFRTKYESLAP
jgi:hypothetical protein